MIRGKRSFAVCLSFTVVVGQDILIAVTFFFYWQPENFDINLLYFQVFFFNNMFSSAF